jgi:hypothetical protein
MSRPGVRREDEHERRNVMSTISHEPRALVRPPSAADARTMWASLAITAMWVAVVVTALFGPDMRSVDVSGTTTTIPSGVAIGLFALFGTMSVARRGLDRPREN